MSNTNFSQRVFCFTEDQAIQACSDIGWLVSKAGFRGVQALELERSLYTTLYQEVTGMNATPAALEYVERRRQAASRELDTIRSCSPDLFDGSVDREGLAQLQRLFQRPAV